MNKRGVFILFLLFFLVTAGVFYFQHHNSGQVRNQVEAVVRAEGEVIHELMSKSGRLFAETDSKALDAFLERLARIPAVLYAGMYKDETLLQLFTRFEGYFPVSREKKDLGFIDSPLGRILNIRSRFEDRKGHIWTIHLGFNSDYIDLMARNAQRGSLFQALVLSFSFGAVILLLFFFNRAFFRKEMELQRERQARERLEELSLFSAEIAHEIRNPLNSLSLTFDALAQRDIMEDERSKRYLNATKKEIRRIKTILDTYTRQSRPVAPRPANIKLKRFFGEMYALLEGEFRQHDAEWDVSLPQHDEFRTDPDLLGQIMQNLIRNSLEAEAKRITIGVSLRGGRLDVVVTDNGEGVPSSRKDQIFKPYISGKSKGTGLGLHVVRRVVTALGGTIRMEDSRPGQTRFRFTLPPGEPYDP